MSTYAHRVLSKRSPFEREKLKRLRPIPGWNGDADRRPHRFDRWVKLPEKAIALYYRVRVRMTR